MAFELQQLREQLIRAVESLARLIERGNLAVAAVEEEVAGTWLGADLKGRLDLRLQDQGGQDVIVDLKWGHSSYRRLLTEGHAVQLAVYAHARRLHAARSQLPPAAYFSLSRARLLTVDGAAFAADDHEVIDGPPVDHILTRIATTMPQIQAALAAGEVAVTGVQRSRPLLDALAIPLQEQHRHYRSTAGETCEYCRFGALCGRAWESRS